jgi:hypothetical protein
VRITGHYEMGIRQFKAIRLFHFSTSALPHIHTFQILHRRSAQDDFTCHALVPACWAVATKMAR